MIRYMKYFVQGLIWALDLEPEFKPWYIGSKLFLLQNMGYTTPTHHPHTHTIYISPICF